MCSTGLLDENGAEEVAEKTPCFAETIAVNKCAMGQVADATEKDTQSVLNTVAKCASVSRLS